MWIIIFKSLDRIKNVKKKQPKKTLKLIAYKEILRERAGN
jgi:hypothetical protein